MPKHQRVIYDDLNLRHDEDHHWAVVQEICDVTDADDQLIGLIVSAVREAYGEQDLIRLAEQTAAASSFPAPAEAVASNFLLENVLAAFREGLPDPAAEGKKPPQLSNYRSETAEIVARSALAVVFQMKTPPALHATKGNRNQPILGPDGWSIMSIEEGKVALVLIQVKATDSKDRPPPIAQELIDECSKAADSYRLKGYLSARAVRCPDINFGAPIIKMMSDLQINGKLSELIVSPVIVRGKVSAHHDDLSSLDSSKHLYHGSKVRALSLSIGADLSDFGRTVMDRARTP